jgi:FkbM family methyltransferase
MYCRNVYLRTGLVIRPGSWVVDLGANAGLFTVLAAVEGARVVAVEAQQGFAPEIVRLCALNRVPPGRVQIEVAMAMSDGPGAALVGVIADDERWRHASHATPRRPPRISVSDLLDRYRIDRIGLLKIDIEGSEFSLLSSAHTAPWLSRVDQIAMEVHPEFGDVGSVAELLGTRGFAVVATDNAGRTVPAIDRETAYLYARRFAG